MNANFFLSMPDAAPRLKIGGQRILSLYFPHLPTDRIARSRWGMSWRSAGSPERRPLACMARVGNAMRLVSLDAAAETIGLKRKQGVAEARAIFPQLDLVEADDDADRRFLAAIADWCDRYTPLVALDGADGLFLDVTGCAHLFGGEPGLIEDVVAKLGHFGLDVRGTISSAPGLSWAIARYGDTAIVAEDGAEAVLMHLPLSALRLDAGTVAALFKLGLKQIGDVLSAPRAPLVRRFGPQLLLRLDQALGIDDEPVSPRRPVASLSAERRLAEAVQTEEDLLHLAGQLAMALKPGLEAQGLGGRLFELMLFRVDGVVFRILAGASSALREPKRIAALFAERFKALHDDLDAGFGFETLRLNVLQAEAFQARQGDFEAAGDSGTGVATFVDQVTARLGAGCLLAPASRESHVPERAWRLARLADDMGRGFLAGAAATGVPAPPRPARPLRLFRQPEAVEATAAVPEGPPVHFRWRRTLHRVVRAEGPERLAAEWWIDGEAAPTRDYFRIEDEAGRRYWLYREGLYDREPNRPQWFMHGVFG